MKYHVKTNANEVLVDLEMTEKESAAYKELVEKLIPIYEKAGPTFTRLLEKYADRVLDSYLPKAEKTGKK